MKQILFVFMMLLGAALAHTPLKSSTPAANSTIRTLPQVITLNFGEALEVRRSVFKVYPLNAPQEAWGNFDQLRLLAEPLVRQVLPLRDDADRRVDTGVTTADRTAKTVTLGLKPDLPPGAYVVMYRKLGVDGHIDSDFFVFVYNPIAATTPLANPLLSPDFWPTATPDSLREAVRGGAEVAARDQEGWIPLHHAAHHNPNPEIIRTLVELGAEVDARDRRDATPLHHAARHNPNPEIIRSLVELGAEVDARNQDGKTPLHVAAGFSKTSEVVLVLLELGADHRARAGTGESAWDLIQGNKHLTDTPAYRRLNELGLY